MSWLVLVIMHWDHSAAAHVEFNSSLICCWFITAFPNGSSYCWFQLIVQFICIFPNSHYPSKLIICSSINYSLQQRHDLTLNKAVWYFKTNFIYAFFDNWLFYQIDHFFCWQSFVFKNFQIGNFFCLLISKSDSIPNSIVYNFGFT